MCRRLGKRVAILGSTGSIGTNTLAVIRHLGEDWRAVAISGCRNLDLLATQAAEFKPAAIGCVDAPPRDFRAGDARLYQGEQGICEMVAREDVDLVVTAIVGAAGLRPTLAAIEGRKTIALANKESLVVAGHLVMPLARRLGVNILPIDSEHSAVFQTLKAGEGKGVKRIILTASGGPFRDWPAERIATATVADALKHPTYRMGAKISVDSATMFNKALEIIEACWLFDVSPSQVEVVIHPESIVHSMVEFEDGSTIAQLSPPDMRLPIQYALTYPERLPAAGPPMDWTKAQSLRFEPPDVERFPALRMAYEVAEQRGSMGAVMNAAKEMAVDAFLAGKVRLPMIAEVVRRTLDDHAPVKSPALEELMDIDRAARARASEVIGTLVA